MLTKLVRTVGLKLGVKWLTGQVRAAAEGKLGARWHALYWGLAGRKRWVGVGLSIVAAILEALGQREAAVAMGVLGGFMFQWGLLDKGWRAERPEALQEHWLYRFLAAHPAELVTVFGVAWAYVEACVDPWCVYGGPVLIALAACAVHLGLLDAAWRAKPPARPALEARVGGVA